MVLKVLSNLSVHSCALEHYVGMADTSCLHVIKDCQFEHVTLDTM